jgi:two-component system sensor histidine kinase YesM
MMSFYMQQIDQELYDIYTYLTYLVVTNAEFEMMQMTDSTDSTYTLAKINFYNHIYKEIKKFKSLGSVYLYSVSRQDNLEVDNSDWSIENRMILRDFVVNQEIAKSIAQGNGLDRTWHVEKIDQKYYLLQTLKFDDIYVCSVCSLQNLLAPLNTKELGENSTPLFVTDTGLPMMNQQLVQDNQLDLNQDFKNYYLQGSHEKFLIVGQKSSQGNFSLVALIPDAQILDRLPQLQRLITLITILFIMLLPGLLLVLYRMISRPMKRMRSAMKQIESGDLSFRIEPRKSSEEFEKLGQSFNTMLDQINDLKIDIYEEKIVRQRIELEQLQLQINPHFFLNSLNIIYTLARAKNFDLIQDMTLSLIEYFRFMFRNKTNFIYLKDELKHVRNYVHIQELRFPNALYYEVDAPAFLQDTLVPTLIVHTFVENAIKHASNLDNPLHLSVKIQLDEDLEAKPFLKIAIRDNGKGFNPEVLQQLREGKRIVDADRDHIGIWNVRQRLAMFYQGKAQITFANGHPDSGAIVEILLPIKEDKLQVEG